MSAFLGFLQVLATTNEGSADTTIQGWIQVILQTGFAGVMLYLILFKWIPAMRAEHSTERAEVLALNQEREKDLVSGFTTTLERIDEQSTKRTDQLANELRSERTQRETLIRETTNMGHQQAIAMVKLTDSVDRLSQDMAANTEVLRSLNPAARRRVTGASLTPLKGEKG